MRERPFAFPEAISQHLQEMNHIPLFGNAPSFDWEEFSKHLRTAFDLPDFHVRLRKIETKEEEAGLGVNPTVTPIFISPMEQPVYWIMSKVDRDQLTAAILGGKTRKKAFSSTSLLEGFYEFILLEALHAAKAISPFEQMTLQLGEKEKIPSEEAITIDIEIECGKQLSWGKLILTKTFQNLWISHFAAFPRSYATSTLAQNLPLNLSVHVGSIQLSQEEWANIKIGDIVLPDALNMHQATIKLASASLFQAEIAEQKLSLIKHTFTSEDFMEDTNAPLSQHLEKSEEEAKAIKDIPLQVHVELARIKLSLDKLMNLSPGNLLELPAHADKKLILSVNGEKVGLAELVSLGDVLGLKILEL